MSPPASLVAGIDHVQVAIPPQSEDRCRAFYVDVLGLAEIAKPAELAARGGLWLAVGAGQLHLGVEAAFRPAAKAHPAFVVTDIDRLAQRLGERGQPLTWGGALEGRRRFYTSDPLGNRLEFIEAKSRA